MEYELRVVVEKVLVSTQEVVKRDTLKTYEVKPPESILGRVCKPRCYNHKRVAAINHMAR